MHIYSIFLAGLISLSSFGVMADARGVNARFNDDSCEWKNTPDGFRRGHAEVPEDWSDRSADRKMISLFYYFRPAEDASLLPIIFFTGEPGVPGQDQQKLLNTYQYRFNKYKGSVIFMDPRGTGCSTAYPQDVRRLKFYTSRSIVEDAESIKRDLFGDQVRWKIFGQGYGGLIVHRYMEIHPESLASADVHGFAVVESAMDLAHQRAKSLPSIEKAFFSKFPDAESKYLKLKKSLKPNRCWRDDTGHTACGPQVLNGFLTLLGNRELHWEVMNRWIEVMESERGERLTPNTDLFVRSFIFDVLKKAGPALDVIRAVEYPGVIAKSTGDDPLTADVTPDKIDLELIRKNLIEHPELKFQLYSGALDPSFPASVFRYEVEFLGSSVRYQELAGGHDGYIFETQVWAGLVARGTP